MACFLSQLLAAFLAIGCPASSDRGFGASAGIAGRMAFARQQNAVNYIYLMDVDASGLGGIPARLTNDPDEENYPSWSPDGKRLAYQRAYNGSAIYVIDADGTNEQRLSPTPGFDVTPSWSPNGAQIVYARLYQAPQPNMPPMTDIRIMNADGSGDRSVLPDTLFSVEPRWSVKGQLVFMSLMGGAGYLQIYLMNADGSNLKQLTSEAANSADPVWSPDGTRISFGSDREGGNKLNVFKMNADGSQQTQLTHFDVPYEAGDTNWSSDGTKIAFEYDINGMKQSDPNAYAEVWTMNADGSGETSTKVRCSDVGCAPRWQPANCGYQPPARRPLEVRSLPAGAR
jgi:TolB protein